jgi:Regulator of chromosome condensation (RCC1) repeat
MSAHTIESKPGELSILETHKSPTHKRKHCDDDSLTGNASKHKRTRFRLHVPKHSDLCPSDMYAIDIHEDDIKKLPYDALTSKKFVQVAAGIRHYAAIDECGQVWTWGYSNENGALGREGNEETPAIVKIPQGVRIVKICCGASITVALSEKGVLYAWGSFTVCMFFDNERCFFYMLYLKYIFFLFSLVKKKGDLMKKLIYRNHQNVSPNYSKKNEMKYSFLWLLDMIMFLY